VPVIDTERNIVAAPIPVGTYPQHVAFSPNGNRAYVVNRSAGTVSVIDTDNNAVVTLTVSPSATNPCALQSLRTCTMFTSPI
jgi:YVTN family beta-propeller protein